MVTPGTTTGTKQQPQEENKCGELAPSNLFGEGTPLSGYTSYKYGLHYNYGLMFACYLPDCEAQRASYISPQVFLSHRKQLPKCVKRITKLTEGPRGGGSILSINTNIHAFPQGAGLSPRTDKRDGVLGPGLIDVDIFRASVVHLCNLTSAFEHEGGLMVEQAVVY